MAMKLSTGKVAFPIEFDNGDKDCIYFNPNDPNLFMRMEKLQDRINERVKELNDIDLNADGTPSDKTVVEEYTKVQNILFSELDYAFGSEVSSVVFKHCSPFAIVDGEYFVYQFAKAIKPEIQKCIKKANDEVEKKMSKHLDKYRK